MGLTRLRAQRYGLRAAQTALIPTSWELSCRTDGAWVQLDARSGVALGRDELAQRFEIAPASVPAAGCTATRLTFDTPISLTDVYLMGTWLPDNAGR